MKKLTQITLVLLGMIVAIAGCGEAQNVVENATEMAGDMANIDFGDFDMAGMKEKFAGITDGFKNVTAENVDGLTSKISELDGSIKGMGIENLPGPAKTAAESVMSKFGETIKGAMGGITDEGILGKLKPVVAPLLEKLGVSM